MSLSPEVRRGGGLPFGQVVSQWVCDPRYSANLRTLYTILVTYADVGARDTGKGKPYRPELAAQLGVSLKTLDRTTEEGECAGLFRVERRAAPGNDKLHDASVYHLRDAEFWRGEWADPLKPGQSAAEAAEAARAKRVAAKRAAGYVHKGGVPKGVKRGKGGKSGGVASPMTPPETGGGGVMGDARGGVTHDATVASPMTPNIKNPVENPGPESVRPSSCEGAEARAGGSTEGRTDGGSPAVVDQELPVAAGAEGPAVPGPSVEPVPAVTPVAVTPGVELLLAVGNDRPELLLTGKVLRDQGLMVTGLLESGWTAQHLRQVVAGRPLPDPVQTSVGAIVAARLRAAAAAPAPATAPPVRVPAPASGYDDQDHHGGRGPWGGPGGWTITEPLPSSTAAADRSVGEALGRRVLEECAGCGRPGTVPGSDLCPICLQWPGCTSCSGPTPRRADPNGTGRCDVCEQAAAGIGAAPAATGLL